MALKPKEPTDSEKLDLLIQRIDPMIEQVNSLYRQFAAGLERTPPREKTALLQSLIDQLIGLRKVNTTYRFRSDSVITRFHSMRDLWLKLVKDVESGKIKRVTGPGRDKK